MAGGFARTQNTPLVDCGIKYEYTNDMLAFYGIIEQISYIGQSKLF
jgi:hypothetical protein